MSNIDRSVTNAEVIPVFESDLFNGHEEARLAIGIIAIGDEVVDGREAEYNAYLKLRAGVYAKQTRMIGEDQVREDGTEVDVDDARSIHFAVFEQHDLGARAVGSMRLIVKTEEDNRPLPVEDFFPDSFKPAEVAAEDVAEYSEPISAAPNQPAPNGALEASRLISRHESAGMQRAVKWKLFAGAVAYIREHRLGPTYATVEKGVEADFKACKMKNDRIAEPKWVDEYKDYNLGVVIDTDDFAQVLDLTEPAVMAEFAANEGQMIYFGRQPAKRTPAPEQFAQPAMATAAA